MKSFPRKGKLLPKEKTISLESSWHKYRIFDLCRALPVSQHEDEVAKNEAFFTLVTVSDS